jgi:hypothetical protein
MNAVQEIILSLPCFVTHALFIEMALGRKIASYDVKQSISSYI